MSLLDPLSCGFAKVAAFNILTTNDFSRLAGENYKEYQSRELQFQYEKYLTYFTNINGFNVTYKQFRQNFKKIIQKIKGLEKRHMTIKNELLETFSETAWRSLSFNEKKVHSLENCYGCQNKSNYRLMLSKIPIKSKSSMQKAAKAGLFKDKVMSDITNVIVTGLNNAYKEVFNEPFSSQVKSTFQSKDIKNLRRETAKEITEDLQGKSTHKTVET